MDVLRTGATRAGRFRVIVLTTFMLAGTAACTPAASPPPASSPANVTPQRLQRAAEEPGNWFTGGRDGEQTFYSPLHDIDAGNVAQLGFAWEHKLGTTNGLEATPIVVDGAMYTSGPWGFVYALDARTGAPLWTYDPKVDPQVSRKACCDIVNRGVAVWRGRVYVGALDGRLIALDAATGKSQWQVDTIVDHERGYTITGAPYIAGELVVIGNSGADLDARGYVSAYHVDSGKLAWRFFTVPASHAGPFEHPELEAAAKTWDPASRWDVGLGGTVWDGMAYDPELDLLYVGTGNSALYPRKLRSPAGGDNLYVASILAIRPKTGRLAWHYQTVPGDQWDYTATAKIVLAQLEIEGKQRKVLMQAPKNGFFYVIDRASGELLSAQPYATVTWASSVDLKTGRPIETPQSDYSSGPKLIFPAPSGAHNWQPMAFNPGTGLVYIPAIETGGVYWIPEEPFVYQRGGMNMGAMYAFPLRNADPAAAQEQAMLAELSKGEPDPAIRGFLRAWDPVRAKVVWQVETSGEWAGEMNALWNGGGAMTTASDLVFQGRSTGYLHIYSAKDGRELRAINVGTNIMAAPMTYSIDGQQYVAVMAGAGGAVGRAYVPGTAAHRYGNAGRIVAFKLGGSAVPLPAEVQAGNSEFPRPGRERFGTRAQIEQGRMLLQRHCVQCHAHGSANGIPDLRRMSAATHAEFTGIVLKGTRAPRGMGSFASLLSADDARYVHAAITDAAWTEYEASKSSPPPMHGPTPEPASSR